MLAVFVLCRAEFDAHPQTPEKSRSWLAVLDLFELESVNGWRLGSHSFQNSGELSRALVEEGVRRREREKKKTTLRWIFN